MNAYCTFPKGCGIPQFNMGSRFWESGWQGGGRVEGSYVRHTQMAGNCGGKLRAPHSNGRQFAVFSSSGDFCERDAVAAPTSKLCIFCSVFRIKTAECAGICNISLMLVLFLFFDGVAFVELV